MGFLQNANVLGAWGVMMDTTNTVQNGNGRVTDY